jgi:hypothetical protein
MVYALIFSSAGTYLDNSSKEDINHIQVKLVRTKDIHMKTSVKTDLPAECCMNKIAHKITCKIFGLSIWTSLKY